MFKWMTTCFDKGIASQAKVARFEPLGKPDTRFWKQVVKSKRLNNEPDYRYQVSSNNIIRADLSDASCLSWCSPLPECEFDYIVFMPGSKLLDNLWTISFLGQAIKSLKNGGQLIIPNKKNDPNVIPQELVAKLAIQTNLTPSPSSEFDGLEFVKTDSYHNQSELDTYAWFVQHSDSIFKSFAFNQQKEMDNPSYFIAETRSNNVIIDVDDIEFLRADFISQEKADLERFLVFSIYGVQQKSFALKHIILDLFGTTNVSWADIGSGSGWVGLQLLVEIGSGLKLTNYEKSLSQAMLGVEAVGYFKKVPVENFRTVVSRVDKVGLLRSERYQIITLITTLCYIEKENQPKLLRSLWAALQPGGYLIIFENIRSESYIRDFSLMFDEDSLGKLLAEFNGERTYRHPLTGKLIHENEAHGKTCYRLIRKL